MTSNDIRTVTLRMNDQDVRQKAENLEKRLENALRIKEDLEKGLPPAFANEKVAVSA